MPVDRFSFTETGLEGLVIVNPFFASDERGYLLKSFEKEVFAKAGLEVSVFEDFESLSKKGVVRGLHFQTLHPQAKYVRAIMGEVFDVAVDLRMDSPTFGRWHAEVLSSENRKGLLIPAGFAHGFQALSSHALISYKCDGAYSPETDTGIRWDDSDLGISWPNPADAVLSARDASLMLFAEYVEKGCPFPA